MGLDWIKRHRDEILNVKRSSTFEYVCIQQASKAFKNQL